jgi:hypothetical protein
MKSVCECAIRVGNSDYNCPSDYRMLGLLVTRKVCFADPIYVL